MKGSFSWRSNSLDAGLEHFEQAIASRMQLVTGRIAAEMEIWAKDEAHHPWQNRTGNAERALHAWREQQQLVHTIYLSHGVDYGLELETRAGGRWGVIQPALDEFSSKITQYVRMLFAGIQMRR
jgi:hypothetical protein